MCTNAPSYHGKKHRKPLLLEERFSEASCSQKIWRSRSNNLNRDSDHDLTKKEDIAGGLGVKPQWG